MQNRDGNQIQHILFWGDKIIGHVTISDIDMFHVYGFLIKGPSYFEIEPMLLELYAMIARDEDWDELQNQIDDLELRLFNPTDKSANKIRDFRLEMLAPDQGQKSLRIYFKFAM